MNMNKTNAIIKHASAIIFSAALSACVQPSLIQQSLPAGSKLITPPGNPNPALCCGSCVGTTCQNCAQMSPLATCNGIVLACPDGEVISSEGEGGCA